MSVKSIQAIVGEKFNVKAINDTFSVEIVAMKERGHGLTFMDQVNLLCEAYDKLVANGVRLDTSAKRRALLAGWPSKNGWVSWPHIKVTQEDLGVAPQSNLMEELKALREELKQIKAGTSPAAQNQSANPTTSTDEVF